MKKPLITSGQDWSFSLIEQIYEIIGEIAEGKYGLDIFQNQIEVISYEQMLEAYSAVGLPVNYDHWSFGKQFLRELELYKKGRMGLAYEIVINSNPCIAYLMEENTMLMQTLVIAHACFGHNSFFKGNYLFQQWTSPDGIIDYMVFAKKYIAECEERYGEDEVEAVLDACHTLMPFAVDKYRKPRVLSAAEEENRRKEREKYIQSQINTIWNTIPGYTQQGMEKSVEQDLAVEKQRFPREPDENILKFIEKTAPHTEDWKREIMRIDRKISQYFYPQRQTQVMNEGWATFWHYTIMSDLFDEGVIDEGAMLEFLDSHTGVVWQPEYNNQYYRQINPYHLGFHMMSDIRRIAENPTKEDAEWLPQVADSNWVDALKFAMHNFKDESFIGQYLSPELIRKEGLFALHDKYEDSHFKVTGNTNGFYDEVRDVLSRQYNIGFQVPELYVWDVDLKGDRTLYLRHKMVNGRPLDEKETRQVLDQVSEHLWKYSVVLESVDDTGKVVSVYDSNRSTSGNKQSITDIFVV